MKFLIVVLFWLVGFFLLWRIPALKKMQKTASERRSDFSEISIIIPARNEAGRIGKLLDSLQNQSITPFEVIVVDDHSGDETAHIAEQAGCTVIEGLDLPEGWTGKNWACWQGARAAQGQWFVFLDADVWLTPDGLSRLVRTYQARGGLVSVQPFHWTKRIYEQLSAYFNIILMAGMNAFTPLRDRLAPKGAFGPVIMCSREDYFLTGGHNGIRKDILESIPMAALFQNHSLGVHLFSGRGAFLFRMYPEGFQQLWEGWTKGFGGGALSIRLSFLFLCILWVWGSFSAAAGLIGSIAGDGTVVWVSLALYMGYVVQMYWILRRIGRFSVWTAILYPIPAVFFAVVMLVSLVMIRVRKRVYWHDREIEV
jgi:4,4'-diaponeurosporenoate glycosyltransferase